MRGVVTFWACVSELATESPGEPLHQARAEQGEVEEGGTGRGRFCASFCANRSHPPTALSLPCPSGYQWWRLARCVSNALRAGPPCECGTPSPPVPSRCCWGPSRTRIALAGGRRTPGDESRRGADELISAA